MLQWLRDNIKAFAWTLWLVIIAFIAFYIPDLIDRGPDATNSVATIGNESVSFEEFRRRYQEVEQYYRQQFGDQFDSDLMRQLQVPLQVANGLIDNKVLLTEAKAMGLSVSDEELRDLLLEQSVFTDAEGRFVGDEQYRRVLRANGYPSAADFERQMRDNLLLDKVRAVLAQNVYVPDAEVERSYREQVERAKVRYVRLPRNRYSTQVQITDQQLAGYYEEHQNEYRQSERRTVSYLLLERSLLRPQIEVTDEEVRAYYESNADEFTREEQVRARHILINADGDEEAAEAERQLEALKSRIEAGEDFAALAREFSDDAGSSQRGGDLNFFGRGRMVPAFEEAAFGAQVGDLVGPVRTDFGVHLIEVMAKQEGGVTPFEQTENRIRFQLQNERAEPEAEARAQAIQARLEAEGLATDEQWEALAEEVEELTFATTPPFDASGSVPTLGRVPDLTTTIFGLEIGEVADPIKVARGWVFVRLNEILDPTIPPLSEVEARVRNAFTRELEQEMAMEALEEARQRITSGESFDTVAGDLGLEATESEEFARSSPIQGLGSAAAAVANSAFSMVVGEVAGPFDDGQGAVLFEVTDRKQWDPSEFEENKELTRQQLEGVEVQRMLATLLQQRRLELDARFTRTFLDSFEVDPDQAQG